ncbi:MAG TPA: (2Fe-2S)-binding protein [Myxococcales bacterium]|nr:(2Fe-2S)-binding protein [Myxococcales bacterium]
MNFVVNGVARTVEVYGLKRLLDVLREDLQLTGAKEGCGEGECGACAVLIDGELVNSCLVAAAQVEGAQVVTVEGIPTGALQSCFVEKGGAQCGICTPGMIVAAHKFLQSGAEATDGNVREAIAGNLCRCTGYAKIVEAVQAVARR